MNELRALRHNKGYSQYQMALALGISLSLYEKVERGAVRASASFMRRVWAFFPDASIERIFFSQ